MTGVNLASVATVATLFVLTVIMIYVFIGVKIHNISSAIKTEAQGKKLEASEKIIEETDKQIKNFKSAVSSAGACILHDKCS